MADVTGKQEPWGIDNSNSLACPQEATSHMDHKLSPQFWDSNVKQNDSNNTKQRRRQARSGHGANIVQSEMQSQLRPIEQSNENMNPEEAPWIPL